MRASLTLIALLFLLAGCFKRKESGANARCTDSCMTFNVKVSTGLNSATILPNAPVDLEWSKPATPLGNPGRLIARGRTADDGTISFSFKAKPFELTNGKFSVIVRSGNDYFLQFDDFYGIRKYDSIVTANVHVPSKAIIKIIYKNFIPSASDDYFECAPGFLTYGSSPFGVMMTKPDGQPSNTHFFASNGSFTRLELTGITAGDQYTHFNINRRKNGARTSSRDSIFVRKGETRTYEVEF